MPETQLILKVIILIVLLLIGFIYIAPIFGFDFLRLITAETITTDIYQPQDKSNDFFYEDYADLNHPGMILAKDGGVDNIDEVLTSRKILTACNNCSDCEEMSPTDLEFNSTKCSYCYACEGISNIREDINGDCIVNDDDITLCTAHFKQDWPPCDLDGNGIVDERDIGAVGLQNGKKCTDEPAIFKNCLECKSTLMGDGNGDCIINDDDVYFCAALFGHPWPSCDIDGDGKVDMEDIALVETLKGKTCTDATCSMCEDMGKEYELCRKIKDCIKSSASWPEYYKKYGCPAIGEISRNENVNFNINTLKNVLKSCESESIKLRLGHNITRELCYFDNTSISFYDFKRQNDFYLKGKMSKYSSHSGNSYAYSYDLRLMPFYKIDKYYEPKYKFYVSIVGLASQKYEIYIEKTHPPGAFEFDPVVENECKVGEITPDSTGFGYAEFDPSDCQDTIRLNNMQTDPENYYINGVETRPMVSFGNNLNVAYYALTPESSETWTKDIRYARCNFATGPEEYLKDRPWWAYNKDNLNSPWIINDGNVNSSMKVFYDSTIPGGGNSPERGNIKISVGRLDTDLLRNCKFDIYVCSQDAFAEYDEEQILTLNDFSSGFNTMNIYKTEKVDVNSDGFKESDLILYNYFIFDLDKNYTTKEIRTAIKTGFRLWEQFAFVQDTFGTGLEWLKSDNNDGIYQDSWNEENALANYNENCWNDAVESRMKLNKKNLIGNCPNDNCTGKLKVRVAFRYAKPNITALGDGWKHPLYPTITFCTEESEVIPSGDCNNGLDDDSDSLKDYNGGSYNSASHLRDPHCLDNNDNEAPTEAIPADFDSWTESDTTAWSQNCGPAVVLSDDAMTPIAGGKSIEVRCTIETLLNYIQFRLPASIDVSKYHKLTFQMNMTVQGLRVIVSNDSAVLGEGEQHLNNRYAFIDCSPSRVVQPQNEIFIFYNFDSEFDNKWNLYTLDLTASDPFNCHRYDLNQDDWNMRYITFEFPNIAPMIYQHIYIDNLHFWYK